MVRPQMEYASVTWDPYYNSDANKLESIQRRAVRWVLSDYSSIVHVESIFLAYLANSTCRARSDTETVLTV